jgi:hypothetical protein
MISITINNPIIENYFGHSQAKIERVLELIATNKIDVASEFDLQTKLVSALNDVENIRAGNKKPKKAKDFLDEL